MRESRGFQDFCTSGCWVPSRAQLHSLVRGIGDGQATLVCKDKVTSSLLTHAELTVDHANEHQGRTEFDRLLCECVSVLFVEKHESAWLWDICVHALRPGGLAQQT